MRRPGSAAALARALLAAAAVLGAWGCAGPRSLDPRTARFPAPELRPPELAEARLSGGSPVFLLEDHDVPLVRVYVSFRGGSLYDPPEQAGLSEVAALAWRTGGAGDLSPEAFDQSLEERAIDLGLGLGRDTGWASLSALPGDLDRGLELLAALVNAPAFREERVAWAASQAGERIRREADDPQDLAFRELRRALYPGHPRGVIPTLETVARVTREGAVDLHRRLLRDGAWAFGVVGDFAPGPLLASLEAHFGSLPAEGAGFPPLPLPPEPEPRTVLVPRALPQASVVWARMGPSRTAPEFYALDVADHLLGSGGFQSRLVREVRSDRGLAYSVGSFYQALPRFGVVGLHAGTRVETLGQVLELLEAVPRGAAQEGFGAGEVSRAQEALVNRHVFRYEDPANTVRERLSLRFDGLPPDLPTRYPGEIQAVGPAEVQAAVRAFDLAAGVLVVVGAVDPADPVWARRGPLEVVTTP